MPTTQPQCVQKQALTDESQGLVPDELTEVLYEHQIATGIIDL